MLLLRGDRSWGLPRAAVPLELWTGDADKVVPALEARLGTKLWQYRQIHATADDERQRIEIVFEMDLIDDDWLPPANGRWVDHGELDRLRIRDRFRPVLDRYLTSLASEPTPVRRMPWCRRGWLAEVRSWIETAIGEHRITNVAQVKQWSVSNVLRVETGGPTFYFKVSAPLKLFVNEAVVSGELARMFPGFVARPLAIRPETGWMLLADLGAVVDDPPLAAKLDAYRRVADLHIRSIARVDELLAAGCHDRRLDVLATQIDPLLADKQVMSNLAAGERRRLLRLAPRLRQYCGALTTYGIPPTLVHGDFHLGNVGPGVDGPILFDWSDACIAHPFIDLHGLDWETTADRNRLLTAYLWRWEGYESSDGLERVLALARILIPLHHAVSYQVIAAGIEPSARPEMHFAHQYLRKLLRELDKPEAAQASTAAPV